VRVLGEPDPGEHLDGTRLDVGAPEPASPCIASWTFCWQLSASSRLWSWKM
jgi:hypothetical protein